MLVHHQHVTEFQNLFFYLPMTCDVFIKPSGFLWLVKLGQSGHILEVYVICTVFPRSIMSESVHNIPVHLCDLFELQNFLCFVR